MSIWSPCGWRGDGNGNVRTYLRSHVHQLRKLQIFTMSLFQEVQQTTCTVNTNHIYLGNTLKENQRVLAKSTEIVIYLCP